MPGVYFIINIPSEETELNMYESRLSSENASESCALEVEPQNVISVQCPKKSEVINVVSNPRSQSVGNLVKNDLSKKNLRTKSAEIFCDTSACEEEPSTSSELSMEKVLMQILKTLKIPHAVWSSSGNEIYKQVTFCCASGRPCEDTLQMLTENGIGIKNNSIISVIPCSLFYEGDESYLSPTKKAKPKPMIEEPNFDQRETSIWEKIVDSSRPRLMVAQVVQEVKSNAEINFDFVVLLIVSAMAAALALVENSLPILVASMLISPIMGPVIAGIFGTAIKDMKLQKMGILNEILGLLICLLIGFLYGVLGALAGGNISNIGSTCCPTPQMMAMSNIRSLVVGMLTAFLSGAAMSIAILGDNTGGVIGVTISVALLPPTVNAGLYWSLSIVNLLIDKDYGFPEHYTPLWSNTPYVELAILGVFSLCLAIVNIICIFLAGILVLKVKEIAPTTTRNLSQTYWNPIILTKNYKTLSSDEGSLQQENFCDDNKEEIPEMNKFMRRLTIGDSIRVASELRALNQFTWSPASNCTRMRSSPHSEDFNSILHQNNLRQPRSLWNFRQEGKGLHLHYNAPSHLYEIWNETMPKVQRNIKNGTNPVTSSSEVKLQGNRSKRFIVTPASPHQTPKSS